MKKGFPVLFIFLLLSMAVRAQLCQGSLGDPIVNITFGSGPNPGAALPAAATGYQHVSADCPNDGQYAVRNSTNNCYGTWHTLTSDHTGDPNGYFMLVNASFQPSAFYLDTVDLFCSNTTYEFAAWAINMMRTQLCNGQPGIEPNLTFSIEQTDGTVLQSINTGNIPVTSTPSWNQYGFFFTAPSGINRVVLRITNNAPGGCGNDLAIDDITFRPCGPQVAATSSDGVTVTNLCQGQARQFNFSATVSTGFNDPFLQWQQSIDNGATWTDIPGANSVNLVREFTAASPVGTYSYRLSVANTENSAIAICRVASSVLSVVVHPRPVISPIDNTVACANSTVTLSASGGAVYQWSGPNGFNGNDASLILTNVQPGQSGRYYIQATSSVGCSSFDSVDLLIHPTPVAVVNPVMPAICEGQSVQLTSSGGMFYSWSPAIGLSSPSVADPVASPRDSIIYRVTVSNEFSCKDTASVQVNVHRRPQVNAGKDAEMVAGQTVRLNGTASGSSISYHWSPNYAIDDVTSLQPSVTPLADTSYILTVNSNVGCGTVHDTVRIRVFKGIFVPTAFTPNGDGLNDVWRIPGLALFKDYEVLVYNRYGQLIFRSTSGQPWNGSYNGVAQPNGVYIYLVRIRDTGQLLKGSFALIR